VKKVGLPIAIAATAAVFLLARLVSWSDPDPRPGGEYGGAAVKKTDEEWRCFLTPEQFEVMRKGGTERPFTGAYWSTKEPGEYLCAGCGAVLFKSDAKFESHTGWPSFWAACGDSVVERVDRSHGMVRREILCGKCGGHLGHVFDDGPKPTGQRYCVNSAALKFLPYAKNAVTPAGQSDDDGSVDGPKN